MSGITTEPDVQAELPASIKMTQSGMGAFRATPIIQ